MAQSLPWLLCYVRPLCSRLGLLLLASEKWAAIFWEEYRTRGWGWSVRVEGSLCWQATRKWRFAVLQLWGADFCHEPEGAWKRKPRPRGELQPGWHLDFRFFSLWTEDPVSQCLHTWPREIERMHLVCLKPPGCGICYTEWGNKYSWWKSHSWQVAEEIIQLMKSDGKASGLSHLNHCFYVRGTSNNKFRGTAPEPSHTDRVGLLGDTTVIREL